MSEVGPTPDRSCRGRASLQSRHGTAESSCTCCATWPLDHHETSRDWRLHNPGQLLRLMVVTPPRSQELRRESLRVAIARVSLPVPLSFHTRPHARDQMNLVLERVFPAYSRHATARSYYSAPEVGGWLAGLWAPLHEWVGGVHATCGWMHEWERRGPRTRACCSACNTPVRLRSPMAAWCCSSHRWRRRSRDSKRSSSRTCVPCSPKTWCVRAFGLVGG